jgi:replicative DNA helicase
LDAASKAVAMQGAKSAQIAAGVMKALDAITVAEKTGRAKPVKELLAAQLARWEALARGEKVDLDIVPTGFQLLDHALGGGGPKGQMTVIAGRPGMGKSSLARAIMVNQGRTGLRSIMFSLEVPAHGVVNAMVASEAGMTVQQVRKPDLRNQVQAAKLLGAHSRIISLPIEIRDEGAADLHAIRAEITRAHQRAPLDCVFVDHIAFVESGSAAKSYSREQEVAGFSRGLLKIAVDFGVWVCCLAQLNRKVEDRADHRPQLADLRESGSIEQDANQVILLYRDGYYSHDDADVSAEAIIAKNRDASCGIVPMIFRPECVRFEDARE